MAESPEHEFLKTHFNDVLRDFSALKLYGFTETDRKRFDFSCLLERDWTRPLAGQVLWRHTNGIGKDIQTLLTDAGSEIKVYLASDTVQHHSAFEETVSDFRRSGRFNDLFRLKAIWIPSDFDADKDKQRLVVGSIVKSKILEDILFNVVFGRITSGDIRLFLGASGIAGLNLVVLHNIATEGFINIAGLHQRLGVSAGPIREKLLILSGAGFITKPIGVLKYEVTPKGRVFLDILGRLVIEYHGESIGTELAYVLTKLECPPVLRAEVDANEEVFPERRFIALIRTAHHAMRHWGIDLTTIEYSDKKHSN